MLALSLTLLALAADVQSVSAAPDTFYLRTTTLNGGREMTRGTAGSTNSTLRIDTTAYFVWYSAETYPTGNDDASIPAGAYTFTLDYNRAINNSTITFTAQVGLSDPDGTNYTQIGESSSQTTANAGGAQTLVVTVCSSCSAQTITAAAPKRLVFRINVTAFQGSGIDLRYEGSAGGTYDSRLDTPTVVVPESGLVLMPVAVMFPLLAGGYWRRKVRLVAGRPVPSGDVRIAKGEKDPDRALQRSSRHSSCNSYWSKGA
jgi:hypothetical protein